MSKTGIALIAVGILSFGLLINLSGKANSKEGQDELTATLEKILSEQEQAWNRGDIDAFMIPYWKSESLTFSSGGETQRGWNATRDRYKARYPDQKTMGKLSFSHLETQSLGNDAALMLGQWQLQRDEPIGGNFSLVWRREGDRWVIMHDHTSARK
jgi:beta-aspartyl-peptidase (threonine type)